MKKVSSCKKCDVNIPKARSEMGYDVCVNCSTEQKKVGHVIYPHKTGAYIQVMDRETRDNLDRLDRRGITSKTSRHYKTIIKKKSEDSDKTAEVRRYRTSSSDNIVHTPYEQALNMVNDYYDEWGYKRTLDYLRQLNSSGTIPLMTRVKIQDIITDRYLQPTPRALARKFNKKIA